MRRMAFFAVLFVTISCARFEATLPDGCSVKLSTVKKEFDVRYDPETGAWRYQSGSANLEPAIVELMNVLAKGGSYASR